VHLDAGSWTGVALVALVVTASAITFFKLMFGEVEADDRQFMRTAWVMLASWVLLLGGALIYFYFLDF
jgi:multisubunit Na+/H+ antiporter MnhB subunit